MRGRSANGFGVSGQATTTGGSYGVGDLPAATAVSDSDTQPICQSPNGCFATDASVTLHGVKQSQLVSYYRTRFFATAPITYDLGSGTYALSIDPTTLAVNASGELTVIGGGPPPSGGAGTESPGGGATETPGGGAAEVAGLRELIATLEARIAVLEGNK